MRRRSAVVSLIVAALALGAVATFGVIRLGQLGSNDAGGTNDQYFSGYFADDDAFPLAYRTIPYGTYVLEFSMDVRFTALDRNTVLECGLVDANGIIGYLGNSPREEVSPTGESRRIQFSGAFQLPDITIALKCTPSRSGGLSVQFSDIELNAIAT